MKRVLAAALIALPLAAQAGDPSGLWQTAVNDEGKYLHVQIGACAGDASQICGTIVQGFGGASQDNNGKAIIWGMQASGENYWRRGTIWAPDDDKTYNSNMTLNGNSLQVEGCVLVFCRGQTWTRVN